MKRTDQGFRNKTYGSHHKYDSPLLKIPELDMVKDFPIGDALHLLHLGVLKRCLTGWRDGSFNNYNTKWSGKDIKEISIFLAQCKLPSEIHRTLRGLDCLAFWKGTEFRTFLQYAGVVILKKYLPYDAYEHFLLLFCATSILAASDVYHHFLNLSEMLLDTYVEKFREIYGVDHITSNIHNLIHLTDDVRRFGPLISFSAYPFENKLYSIKCLLRNGRFPLAQVARRLHELTSVENNDTTNGKPRTDYFISLKNANNGENVENALLQNIVEHHEFFYKATFRKYGLNTKEDRNRWFLTHSKQIVCAENIISFSNNAVQIYGCSLKNIFLFFETPIKSSYLDIYCSDGIKNNPNLYKVSEVKCKLAKIDFNEEMSVFVPLLHTINVL